MLLGLQRNSVSEGTNYVKMPVWKAFVIGLSQAFAILPGISRSGSTIATGAMLGLNRESAATFSFLLAIPAIGGAMLLQIIGVEGFSMPISQALLGIGISFVVGLVSLSVLIRMLGAGKLHWFAAWLFPLGAAVIIWQCLAS
jgi:undecaprenyl-diphosphatase